MSRKEKEPVIEKSEEENTAELAPVRHSALFLTTLDLLMERERGRCWLSGITAKQSKSRVTPIYWPVAPVYADAWDWPRFSRECQAGKFGVHAKAFDWLDFFRGAQHVTDPDTGAISYRVRDPMLFVDNLLVNGRLLLEKFHSPLHEYERDWIASAYVPVKCDS